METRAPAAAEPRDYPTVPHAGEYEPPGAAKAARYLVGAWTTIFHMPVQNEVYHIHFTADGGYAGYSAVGSRNYPLEGTWEIRPLGGNSFNLILYGSMERTIPAEIMDGGAFRDLRSHQIYRREGG